jgi:hypothetical protein
MARTANVLSSQVYGKLDWVSMGEREVGMFLKTSERKSTRVVLRGPEVERMLANGLLQKGMMVTAHGGLSARCMQRKDDNSWMAELLVDAARIAAEPAREGRLRGSVYVCVKGIVLNWNPNTFHILTYMNPGEFGCKERSTVSLFMQKWVIGMSKEGQSRFLSNLYEGREFTSVCLAEVSCYQATKTGIHVPVIELLPTDFKLQG